MRLERPSHSQDLEPVGSGFLLAELRRLRHVAASPDHDGVAVLDVVALKVRVRDLPGEDPCPETGLLGTPLGAHRAALATAQFIERFRPLHHQPTLESFSDGRVKGRASKSGSLSGRAGKAGTAYSGRRRRAGRLSIAPCRK